MAIARIGMVIEVADYIVSGACDRPLPPTVCEYGETGLGHGFKPAQGGGRVPRRATAARMPAEGVK